MNLRRLLSFFNLFLFLSASNFITNVSAESQVGAFTFSPFIGEYLFDGVQHIKSRPSYGLRFGQNITERGSIEAMFAYIGTKSTTEDDRRINVFRYGIDGQYRFTLANKNLIPFISVGVGVISFDNPSGINNTSLGLINYGPGLLWTYSDTMGVRTDLRHSIVSNNHYSNYEATLGLIFLFGGDKRSVESVKPTEPAKPSEQKNDTQIKSNSTSSYQKIGTPVIELSDIHFAFDSSLLSSEGQKILNNTKERMKNNSKIKIRIEGHASAIGTVDYNQKLSEQRANAVKDYLLNDDGISSDRITTIGYGESKPIMHEPYPERKNSKEAKANMVTLEFENIDNTL
ncbi:MAG: OmpA family protein [Oligoflexia bacterium]|nr:OmpA family protein [Oligoflexia bacterium]